ncbi:MAG: hypothetical protein ABI832_15975 [bacterium]
MHQPEPQFQLCNAVKALKQQDFLDRLLALAEASPHHPEFSFFCMGRIFAPPGMDAIPQTDAPARGEHPFLPSGGATVFSRGPFTAYKIDRLRYRC